MNLSKALIILGSMFFGMFILFAPQIVVPLAEAEGFTHIPAELDFLKQQGTTHEPFSIQRQHTVTTNSTTTSADDWTTYLYDAGRSSYNYNETMITASNAASLKQNWVITNVSNSAISIQPVVVGNRIYWGSWDGIMHASDLNGNTIWSKFLGVNTPPAANNCNPPSIGIASSASVRTINVNSVPTQIVYVGGGDGKLYALYADSGNVLWSTQLADITNGGFLWSSPAEFNGSVYMGVASFGDCPLVQGKLVQLNWRFGTIQNVAKLVPDGCVGAGLWASPTIDRTFNKIYIATGTQDNSCKVNGQSYVEPYALAVVELDLNLNILGAWRIPASEQGPDSDFGVAPTLSYGKINGVKTRLISAANKNGIYYTFIGDHISDGPIWKDVLGIGGTCPDCAEGSISSSAYDGKLYQGSGSTTINGVNYKASIRAIDPATGSYVWEHGLTHALVAAPTIIHGVLIVPEGNLIDVMNSNTGKELIQLHPPGANSVFDAPVSVSQGLLFAGNLNGTLYEFGL